MVSSKVLNISKLLFSASFVILALFAVGIMLPDAVAEHTSVNKNVLDPADLFVNIRDVTNAINHTIPDLMHTPASPLVGETIEITLVDLDANLDGATVETVEVVVSSSSGDSETVVLTETAVSSGTFVGTIAVSAGNAPGTIQMEARGGDQITIVYDDENVFVGRAQIEFTGGPGVGGFNVDVRDHLIDTDPEAELMCTLAVLHTTSVITDGGDTDYDMKITFNTANADLHKLGSDIPYFPSELKVAYRFIPVGDGFKEHFYLGGDVDFDGNPLTVTNTISVNKAIKDFCISNLPSSLPASVCDKPRVTNSGEFALVVPDCNIGGGGGGGIARPGLVVNILAGASTYYGFSGGSDSSSPSISGGGGGSGDSKTSSQIHDSKKPLEAIVKDRQNVPGFVLTANDGIIGKALPTTTPKLNQGKYFEPKIGDTKFGIGYKMAGSITGMTPDKNSKSISFDLKSVKKGTLTLSVPRSLIDSPNDKFNVYVTASPEKQIEYEIIHSTSEFFTIQTKLPDGAKNLRIESVIEKIDPDSIVPEQPLTIDGKGYALGGKYNTIVTNTIQTQKPTNLKLVLYEGSAIEHLTLYTNLQKSDTTVSNSDTFIKKHRDKDIVISDPNGFFSNVDFKITEVGDITYVVNYDITFAKPMEKSNIVFRTWDDKNQSADIVIFDAWEAVTSKNIENLSGSGPILKSSESIISSSEEKQSSSQIPIWVKSNADWWAKGQIDDSDFVAGIEFLIQEEIISVPTSEVTESTDEIPNEIPDWIKGNAGWWAEGMISNDEFLQAIEWLIANGVMKV